MCLDNDDDGDDDDDDDSDDYDDDSDADAHGIVLHFPCIFLIDGQPDDCVIEIVHMAGRFFHHF